VEEGELKVEVLLHYAVASCSEAQHQQSMRGVYEGGGGGGGEDNWETQTRY
jgi:hypothetical protein